MELKAVQVDGHARRTLAHAIGGLDGNLGQSFAGGGHDLKEEHSKDEASAHCRQASFINDLRAVREHRL
jgi:hypothetical protein